MSSPNPYARWVAVTASADAFEPTDAIYVGTAGTITVTLQGGDSVAIPCAAGQELHIKAIKVTSLGAATSVFRCYW